jgi:hypothetical protein
VRARTIAFAVSAVAALATAAEAAGAGWLEDPYGDTFGSPPGPRADVDLTDAYYGRAGDRLIHVVKVAGQMPSPERDDLDALLLIDVPGDWGGTHDYCDYYVDRSGDGAAVYRCGSGQRMGSARVVRRNGNGIRYTFSRAAIGDPDSYDWALSMRGDANGVRDEFDRLPDGLENFHRHSLR